MAARGLWVVPWHSKRVICPSGHAMPCWPAVTFHLKKNANYAAQTGHVETKWVLVWKNRCWGVSIYPVPDFWYQFEAKTPPDKTSTADWFKKGFNPWYQWFTTKRSSYSIEYLGCDRVGYVYIYIYIYIYIIIGQVLHRVHKVVSGLHSLYPQDLDIRSWK